MYACSEAITIQSQGQLQNGAQLQEPDWTDFLKMGTGLLGGLVPGEAGAAISNVGNTVANIGDAAQTGNAQAIIQASANGIGAIGNTVGGDAGKLPVFLADVCYPLER